MNRYSKKRTRFITGSALAPAVEVVEQAKPKKAPAKKAPAKSKKDKS